MRNMILMVIIIIMVIILIIIIIIIIYNMPNTIPVLVTLACQVGSV